MRSLSSTAWLFAGALFLTACVSDGKDLAEPRPDQTTTTRPAPPTSAPDQLDGESGVSISSPDFEPGDRAPGVVRCSGINTWPTIIWTGVPEETAEMALALIDQTDPDEPLLFWLAAGIDPTFDRIESGVLPNGAYETLNDYGQTGWGNPCLESAQNGLRDLQFKLYIMPNRSGVAPGQAGNEAWDLVTSQAVDSATILMRIDASTG